jgi:hypothetical protein
MRHALRQGWAVSNEAKDLARQRMTQLLKDDQASERSWVAAAKVLVSMTQATTSAIDTALKARQFDEEPIDLDAPQAFDERGDPIES